MVRLAQQSSTSAKQNNNPIHALEPGSDTTTYCSRTMKNLHIVSDPELVQNFYTLRADRFCKACYRMTAGCYKTLGVNGRW